MKPVIRTTDNSIHDGSGGYIAQVESLIPLAGDTYLFTADQLREAQVKVLREALQDCSFWQDRAVLERMADELEKDDAIRGLA